MKKEIICIGLAGSLLTGQCWAYQTCNLDASESAISSESMDYDAEAPVHMLRALGLLQDTAQSFAPDSVLTRAEAAVFFTRFLHAEEEAQAGVWTHPFSDVPAWADSYVGWMYQKGLLQGVTPSVYGASQPISEIAFATVLSRVISGQDDCMASGVLTEEEILTAPDRQAEAPFHKRDAAALSVRALALPVADSETYETLAQVLLRQGAFSVEQFSAAAWGVIAPVYSYRAAACGGDQIVCKLAGITVAANEHTDLIFDQTENRPYLYAYAREDRKIVYYHLDARTLECMRIGERALAVGTPVTGSYLGTIGEKDYLWERYQRNGESPAQRGALLCWDGTRLHEVVSAEVIGSEKNGDAGRELILGAFDPVSGSRANSFALAFDQTVYSVSEAGIRRVQIPVDAELLYQDTACIVTQQTTPQETTISCIDLVSGQVVDRYTVPQDLDGYERTVELHEPYGLYGEAGWYLVQDGRLRQIADAPVLDVLALESEPSEPYLLTHGPGYRVSGQNSGGGDAIFQLRQDGAKAEILSNTPAHGIEIAGLQTIDGALAFYSAQPVGMQRYNQYLYRLEQTGTETRIIVIDYVAGRPETEENSTKEAKGAGYQRDAIEKEQDRLNRLGLGN